MLLAASDIDFLWPLVALLVVVVAIQLQVLWALRVMRALESSARSAEAGAAHLDQMRNAIIVTGRHIRGEQEPAAAAAAPRPRHSPKI